MLVFERNIGMFALNSCLTIDTSDNPLSFVRQRGRVVKAVDLKSTTFACVGSSPTAVVFFHSRK